MLNCIPSINIKSSVPLVRGRGWVSISIPLPLPLIPLTETPAHHGLWQSMQEAAEGKLEMVGGQEGDI